MKITSLIIENQIEVLKNMNIGIKNHKVKHIWENGIVYDIDLNENKEDIHISILFDWNKEYVSMQIFMDNSFNQVKKENATFDNFHSIVINEIFKYI